MLLSDSDLESSVSILLKSFLLEAYWKSGLDLKRGLLDFAEEATGYLSSTHEVDESPMFEPSLPVKASVVVILTVDSLLWAENPTVLLQAEMSTAMSSSGTAKKVFLLDIDPWQLFIYMRL